MLVSYRQLGEPQEEGLYDCPGIPLPVDIGRDVIDLALKYHGQVTVRLARVSPKDGAQRYVAIDCHPCR